MQVETLKPCPACGGTLAIEPGQDALRCVHCDARHAPEGIEVSLAQGCGACGGRFVVNPQVMAAACPFCTTPFTVPPGQDRHEQPDFVVPFAVSERDARDGIRAWLSRQWLAPQGLRKSALSGDALHAMYVPYWKMIGEGRSEQVHFFMRQLEWTDTDDQWPPPSRDEYREPLDALVEGSDTLPSYVRQSFDHWDLSTAAPYAPARLSGTLAEIASLTYAKARARVANRSSADLADAAPQPAPSRTPSFRTGIRVDYYGLFLMPIWLSAYRWRGRVYRVAVHGQSGAVTGQRPLSGLRFWTMIAVLALAPMILYLIALTH